MNYSQLLKWTYISALCCFLALAAVSAKAAGQITFSVEINTASNGTVTPKATWSTTPAASTCTATGGWTGAKAASGSEILPPVSVGTVYNITCLWNDNQAALSWTTPSQNTDGSTLTDLKGYHLYISDPDGVQSTVNLDGTSITSYLYTTTKAGTYSFSITAVTQVGIESPRSNPVTKVAGASSDSRSAALAVKIPATPSNFTAK